ncbi:DUF7674 family protein [Aeromonas dhakensis]|uniref:DUF7674 family protein n=1 Tax=Aeromonas dhakensis TaxID=196024 RepID=UPI00111B3FD4|nr:hypothetical protein [Aeromonas dhakensis]
MIAGEEALYRIENEFPEISEKLREDEGLLHIHIGEFSHHVQSFIDNGNENEFGRVCKLFVELFSSASPELENALNVSFLENLNFTDGKNNRSWAYSAMPPLMRKAWDEMDEYNSKLHGNR